MLKEIINHIGLLQGGLKNKPLISEFTIPLYERMLNAALIRPVDFDSEGLIFITLDSDSSKISSRRLTTSDLTGYVKNHTIAILEASNEGSQTVGNEEIFQALIWLLQHVKPSTLHISNFHSYRLSCPSTMKEYDLVS